MRIRSQIPPCFPFLYRPKVRGALPTPTSLSWSPWPASPGTWVLFLLLEPLLGHVWPQGLCTGLPSVWNTLPQVAMWLPPSLLQVFAGVSPLREGLPGHLVQSCSCPGILLSCPSCPHMACLTPPMFMWGLSPLLEGLLREGWEPCLFCSLLC